MSVLERQAERELPKTAKHDEPVKGLRQHLRARLADWPGPSLETIAAVLRVSPRTLQRRRSDAGTTFQRELDCVREELAIELLADASLSVHEVALRVGYAEHGAFERSVPALVGDDAEAISATVGLKTGCRRKSGVESRRSSREAERRSAPGT